MRLDTTDHIRREVATIYSEGKHGRREVGDASKLANILWIAGRLIEGSELRQRIEVIEQKLQELAAP